MCMRLGHDRRPCRCVCVWLRCCLAPKVYSRRRSDRNGRTYTLAKNLWLLLFDNNSTANISHKQWDSLHFFFFYWPNIHPLEEDFHRKSWAIKLLYFLFPHLQSVHPTHANTSHRYWSNEQKWKKKQKNRNETLCVSGRFAIYAYRIHTRWYLCATRAVAIQFYYFLKKEQRKKIVDNKNNFYFFIDSGSVFRYIYVCPECLYVLDCASCCSLPSSMEWDVGREHTEWVSEREVRFLSL